LPARLAFRSYGQGETVLLLHGLFGSAAQWHHIAVPLSRNRRVLAVDLRNHGASPHTASMDYRQMSEDLRALVDAQGLEEVAVVGHSMGGKLAMAFALQYPQRTRSLAVVDIAPTTYADGFTALIYAALRVDLATVRRREDADAQLARHVPSARLRTMLLQNLVRRGDGWDWRIHWRGIATGMKDLLGFPPPLCRRKSQVPALFVGGAASDFLGGCHEGPIRALFAHVAFDEIADAGHWVHVDQPGALTHRLDAWLQQSDFH
jgi:pimeloyl-ACP methyl ester carboxylesterase